MNNKYTIYYYNQFYMISQICIYANSAYDARQIAMKELQYLKMFPNRIYNIQVN